MRETTRKELDMRKADLSHRMREIVRLIRSINPDLTDFGHAQLRQMENEIARLKIENDELNRKIHAAVVYGRLPS